METEAEQKWISARDSMPGWCDEAWYRHDLVSAKALYKRGLERDPMMTKTYAKLALLGFGKWGDRLRGVLGSRRGAASV